MILLSWLTNWWHYPIEPTHHVFLGVPAYAIERMAKLFQFGAGSVIILEVIGKDRVETWGKFFRRLKVQARYIRPIGRVKEALIQLASLPLEQSKPGVIDMLLSMFRRSQNWLSLILPAIGLAADLFSAKAKLHWNAFLWIPVIFFGSWLLYWGGFEGFRYCLVGFYILHFPHRDQPTYEKIVRLLSTCISAWSAWLFCSVIDWGKVYALPTSVPILQAVYLVPLVFVWFVGAGFAGIALVSFLFYSVLMFSLSAVWICTVVPTAWVAGKVADFLLRVMTNSGVYRFILGLAVVSLVIGFLLDLAMS